MEDRNVIPGSGTSRQRRYLSAPETTHFKIDERTLADFLVFTEKYAEHIFTKFTPDLKPRDKVQYLAPDVDQEATDNTELLSDIDAGTVHEKKSKPAVDITKHNWKSFFSADITVFLAKLLQFTPEQLASFYLPGKSKEDPENFSAFHEKLQVVFEVVNHLSTSYKPFIRQYSHDVKFSLINKRVEQLRLLFVSIYSESANLFFMEQDQWHQKYPAIQAWTNQENTRPYFGSPTSSSAKKLIELVKALNQFLSYTRSLVAEAKDLFEYSIHEIPKHSPGVALYIAFLRLYEYVQEDLNSITQKHLDYFYRDLLGLSPKGSEPDEVHVCFTLADHIESYDIQKGTHFVAGADEEGFNRIYEASDYLSVTKTKITDLASIYISKQDKVNVEDDYEFVSAIYRTPIQVSEKGGFDFSLQPRPYHPFGEEQRNIQQPSMIAALVGWAISSPVLLLAEGRREISLSVSFQMKSLSSLISFLERYTQQQNISVESAYDKLFSKAFRISLTTEKGWYRVNEYRAYPPDWSTGTMKFTFLLNMGAPAIVPMNEAWENPLEREMYNTQSPVMKIELENERSMYPYSYLMDLVVSEFAIGADVDTIKNLLVFNDLGQLDTSKPFFPFGSIPVKGSRLLIGNEELYKKHINDFTLELTWHNLPAVRGGFKEYYKEYEGDYSNESFKVALTALSDYQFYPEAENRVQEFSLFHSSDEDEESENFGKPDLKTIIKNVDIDALRINVPFQKNDLQPFSNSSSCGYLKLELSSPDGGFGQDQYPVLLSNKMIQGIKKSNIEMPNVPYVPQLKSLTLNYKASTRIVVQKTSSYKSDALAKEKVFHLHPHGIETVFRDGMSVNDWLVPQYHHNGYLLIGLDQVPPAQDLSLYFGIDPTIGNEFEVELPSIDWYFLASDSWIPFDKKQVIIDSTRNFTTSGIVKLFVPSTISNQNTRLPSGKYWIVAALHGDVNLAGKLTCIYTQAMKLSWQAQRPGISWEQAIPAGTISSFETIPSEITSVFQPHASFGGRRRETDEEFYIRVSERLKHKNRAVTTNDIERIVLEKFPFVQQARCISAVENYHGHPGEIVLVVVPKIKSTEKFSLPKFNYGTLQEIKDYVSRLTSPFVKLEVTNPVYEEVKITASLVFKDETQKGQGMEQLSRSLQAFIAPWSVDENAEMQFGGSVNLQDLIAYLDVLPYLKYSTNVSIWVINYHDKKYSIADTVVTSDHIKTLHASKPWSVLVPMKSHQLTFLEKDGFVEPEKVAIDNMRVGVEFVIGSKEGDSQKDKKETLPVFDKYVSIDVDI